MCRHRRCAAGLVPLFRPSLPAPLAGDRVEHSWASCSQTLSSLVLAAEAPGWLADITVPVTLVAAPDDKALDHAVLVELASRHSHVQLDEVTGGHDFPLAQPEICEAIIRDAITSSHRPDT